jgi:hypothetical protein
MNSGLELVLICFGSLAFFIFLWLLSFGVIGPRSLKDLMRRYQKWRFGDAEPLLPIDPYKPFCAAPTEQASQFPPPKTRLKNALLLQGLTVLVIVIVLLIALFIIVNL